METQRMNRSEAIKGRLLPIREAAAYTGLAVETLYKMVSHRKIPHVKLGGKLLFDVALLDQWIKQNTVMPMPEKTSGQ